MGLWILGATYTTFGCAVLSIYWQIHKTASFEQGLQQCKTLQQVQTAEQAALSYELQDLEVTLAGKDAVWTGANFIK